MNRYQKEWELHRSRLMKQIEQISATRQTDERDRLLQSLNESLDEINKRKM